MRALVLSDSHAAFLKRRGWRWLFITLTMWFFGFAVLGLTFYMLHRRGIV
jgi:hypothetical protein